MRNLQTTTVRRFRGLDQRTAITALGPDFAIDCRNVIVNNAGFLEKLRAPVALGAAPEGIASGPDSLAGYYKLSPLTRQYICQFGTSLYVYDALAQQPESQLPPSLIETDERNAATYDAVESNNILFMSNGERGPVKWIGDKLENWGIDAPPSTLQATGKVIGLSPTINDFAYSRAGGVTTVTCAAPHNLNSGESFAVLDALDSSFNTKTELFVAAVIDANTVVYLNAGPDATTSNGFGVEFIGSNDLVTSMGFRAAYKNSLTGHVSSMTDPVVVSGPITRPVFVLIVPPPTDPQVDEIELFATLDGGSDYYLWKSVPSTQLLNDDLGKPIAGSSIQPPDVNTAIIGSLVNGVPPADCKYLARFQNRIFAAGMESAPADIAYSGYERIFHGRPEESFPPNNRLRLAVGADDIRGIGVIQAGVIAFTRSDQMFMLRGIVEDITIDAPVLFSSYLEELPWNIGAASHHSIASTPFGLVWLASDRTVQIYNGVGLPADLSGGAYALLRSMTPGRESNARGAFLNWLERDWYALCIAVDGGLRNNLILMFDLTPRAEENAGIFVFDLGEVESIGVLEDANGQRLLVVGQKGQLLRIRASSPNVNGLNIAATATDNTLYAYWKTGYFGNEEPRVSKTWRFGRLLSDNGGFNLRTRMVDDEARLFTGPEIIDLGPLNGTRFTVNRKAKRSALEIEFPQEDVDCNVIELSYSYVPTGQR